MDPFIDPFMDVKVVVFTVLVSDPRIEQGDLKKCGKTGKFMENSGKTVKTVQNSHFR